MPSRKLSLRLRPQGRAYSRLQLSGVIPTTPSAQDLRLFCYLLSLWQGSPLDVALSLGVSCSRKSLPSTFSPARCAAAG
jgi:hypothetical protein